MSDFLNRMIRASKIDVHLFEEVEADPRAMGQAMAVVILSSLAAGVGTISRGGAMGILLGTVLALLGWYVWAYLTYLIGTRILPEAQTQTTPGELLRTIGFSSAPGLIRILGVIPALTGVIFLIAGVWMLTAMVVAVRQALDYRSTWRAIGVCVIGWAIQLIILALAFSILR